MGEITGISWTDHTFNPWIGCTKVSPACDNCYAEALAQRYGWAEWGNHPRKRTSEATWRNPLAWDRKAAKDCVKRFVFCASLADVFDNQVDPQWRSTTCPFRSRWKRRSHKAASSRRSGALHDHKH